MFDNDLFPYLMVGVPSWLPFRIIQDGLAVRSRLIDELDGLYRRIDQYQRGEPVDFDADMSDISEAALERNRIFNRDGWTFPERGVSDLTNIWAQNANTQPLLFWFLTYVYFTDGVIERLREEIAPYVRLSPIMPHGIINFDVAGLSKSCQLLKACIFETYRFVNEPTSLRYVARAVVINDGDAKHEINPGTYLSAPHSIINRNLLVFSEPDNFNPDRFLKPDQESGKLVAQYGRLKPWGSGTAICKGRTFAEKETILVGAAIISLWDIKPVSGSWELPKMLASTRVKKPVSDVRVLVTRRRS
jgi:cytochrome P450